MDNVFLLVIALIMSICNGLIAKDKGYSGVLFGVVSLVNWLIPFLIVICLPRREDNEKR